MARSRILAVLLVCSWGNFAAAQGTAPSLTGESNNLSAIIDTRSSRPDLVEGSGRTPKVIILDGDSEGLPDPKTGELPKSLHLDRGELVRSNEGRDILVQALRAQVDAQTETIKLLKEKIKLLDDELAALKGAAQ